MLKKFVIGVLISFSIGWGVVWIIIDYKHLYTEIQLYRRLVNDGITTTAVVLQKYTEFTDVGPFRLGGDRHLNFMVYQFSDTTDTVWEGRKEIKDATLWEKIQEQGSIHIRYLKTQPSINQIVGNPLYTTEEKVHIFLGASFFLVMAILLPVYLYFYIWSTYGSKVKKFYRHILFWRS